METCTFHTQPIGVAWNGTTAQLLWTWSWQCHRFSHQKRPALWMVKVTVMRKKKAEWRSSVGNSQGQSSWPHSIPQNCAVRDLWVKGCEEVPMFLGKVFWGFTVCFIVCIRLNGRMTMFYFHTMFTFQEPAHYLPLWRASCRSLLPQQGCTQNAEGLVLPTRCRFGWFDDVCLGTSKTQLAKTTKSAWMFMP